MDKKKRDESVEALVNAGCCKATISDFLNHGKANNKLAQMRMLDLHRRALLDQVHEFQKKIDVLDYLVYRIEKESK